jgi:hypothetical protein
MRIDIRVYIAIVLAGLMVAKVLPAQNRDKSAAKPKEEKMQVPSVDDKDQSYYKQFLDKDGGYKDKKGGYYNVTAGTYTDETGGVVDNWAGYTYKSGSYKSRYGDFYDAKENTFKLTDGQVIKGDPGTTPPQAIKLMRDDIEARGGFDKDFTRKSMMQQIRLDHPKPNDAHPPKSN